MKFFYVLYANANSLYFYVFFNKFKLFMRFYPLKNSVSLIQCPTKLCVKSLWIKMYSRTITPFFMRDFPYIQWGILLAEKTSHLFYIYSWMYVKIELSKIIQTKETCFNSYYFEISILNVRLILCFKILFQNLVMFSWDKEELNIH